MTAALVRAVVDQHVRSLRSDILRLALVALLPVLVFLNISSGVQRQQEMRSSAQRFTAASERTIHGYQAEARKAEERLTQQHLQETIPAPFGSRHPAYASGWARPARVVSPPPLAWVAVGREDLFPVAFTGDTAAQTGSIDNPLRSLLGYNDLSFTAVYVLPLFWIALGYDLIVSDRSSGFARMTATGAASQKVILLVRLAVSQMFLLGAFLLSSVVAVLVYRPQLDLDLLTGLAVLIVGVLCYSAFWSGVIAIANLRAMNAPQSLLLLLVVWFMALVAVPFTANQVASLLRPAPTSAELLQAQRTALLRPQAYSKQAAAAFQKAHPEVVAATDPGQVGKFYLERAVARYQAEEESWQQDRLFEERLQRQQSVADTLSAISPSVLVDALFERTAQTGRERYERFSTARKVHEDAVDSYFALCRVELPQCVFTSSHYDRIPRFTFIDSQERSVIQGLAWVLDVLALEGLGALGLAFLMAQRISPAALVGIPTSLGRSKRNA